MGKRLVVLILILAVALGALLRLKSLSTIPAGLHTDEALAGYNAFLLEKTGKNLNGRFLPVDIDSFGDFRPAMVSYLSVPAVAALGLGIFSTRLPVALLGTLLIILTYIFVRQCWASKKIALLATLLLATSPMAIIFSRATSEAVLDVFFELLALLAIIVAFRKRKPWYLLATYLFWVFAYFSYHTSRVLTFPMGVATIVLSYFQFRPGKKLLVLAVSILAAYFLFPWLYFLRTPIGQGRLNQVNLLAFPEVQRSIDENIREDGHGMPTIVSRIFHNKLLGYLSDGGKRYLSFFSPNLVLFSLPKPERYFVPDAGPISLVELTGLLLAMVYLLGRGQKPLSYLPLVLLLLAPLPAALTFEDAPNFQRAIYLTPFWQIVAAIGMVSFLSAIRLRLRLVATVTLIVVVSFQTDYFLHQYFFHQPNRFLAISRRTTEMEALSSYLASVKRTQPGAKILLSEHDAPYLFYLFFNRINIFDVSSQKESDPNYFTGDYQVDNMTFFHDVCLLPEALFRENYDIVVFNQGCWVPGWSQKIAEFRRSDKTFASAAYKLDQPTYQWYKLLLSQTKSPEDKKLIYQQIAKTYVKKE